MEKQAVPSFFFSTYWLCLCQTPQCSFNPILSLLPSYENLAWSLWPKNVGELSPLLPHSQLCAAMMRYWWDEGVPTSTIQSVHWLGTVQCMSGTGKKMDIAAKHGHRPESNNVYECSSNRLDRLKSHTGMSPCLVWVKMTIIILISHGSRPSTQFHVVIDEGEVKASSNPVGQYHWKTLWGRKTPKNPNQSNNCNWGGANGLIRMAVEAELPFGDKVELNRSFLPRLTHVRPEHDMVCVLRRLQTSLDY